MRCYVLVHGFWLGSWAWDEVRNGLEAAGHHVIAPTLPGNERDHPRAGVSLEGQVSFVHDLVAAVDDPEVVLVGHSAGGAVVHAVVDRNPDRIHHVVYADTRPLPDGVALNRSLAGDGDQVPVRGLADFAPGWLDDMDASALHRFERLATPSPAGPARDAQHLTDERRFDTPITVVATTMQPADFWRLALDGDPHYAELPRFKRVSFAHVPTGHYPMLSKPEEFTELLLGI